jgi:hypothetical protein
MMSVGVMEQSLGNQEEKGVWVKRGVTRGPDGLVHQTSGKLRSEQASKIID